MTLFLRQHMRLIGFLLLSSGFLLCVTIVLAAIGFLAMSLGLICLLIEENYKKRETTMQIGLSPISRPRARTFKPSPDPKRNQSLYEADKWRSIVKADPDIEKVAAILSQYGASYVDQLARVYLVFEDKALLPKILELIVTSAKVHKAMNTARPSPTVASQTLSSDSETIVRSDNDQADFSPQRSAPTRVPLVISTNDRSEVRSDATERSERAVTSVSTTSEGLSALLEILANAK
jgi:hypothetical protein